MPDHNKDRDADCRRWIEEIYRPWYETNASALSGNNGPPPPPPEGDG